MNGKHVLYMLNIESEYYVTGLHAWNREYFLWHLETFKKEISGTSIAPRLYGLNIKDIKDFWVVFVDDFLS